MNLVLDKLQTVVDDTQVAESSGEPLHDPKPVHSKTDAFTTARAAYLEFCERWGINPYSRTGRT